MKLIDSHGHLTDETFETDLNEVIERAKDVGLVAIVSAGYDIFSSQKAIKLASENSMIYATAGVHPENYADFNLEEVENLIKNPKVVAVGEIGLDYHYFNGLEVKQINKIKDLQMSIFIKQIELANKYNLPIVVHSRDAMFDTIETLKKYKTKKESLLHCYNGSIESARILMDLGYSFSFGGVTTFSNAKNVVEVVKELPIENILLETDCPYLSPEPYRGKRNEPKNVVYVADKIAKIKGMKIEDVAEITTQNAKRLFGI